MQALSLETRSEARKNLHKIPYISIAPQNPGSSKKPGFSSEDLKIKGLARTHWGKSILDAAWGSFITILEAVAVRRGVRVKKVNPSNTSQDCSGCGVKVKKDLSIRWHSCPHCHTELDRDINAARNILKRAIEDFKAVGLIVSACGGERGYSAIETRNKGNVNWVSASIILLKPPLYRFG